ncbi:hypothetical protein H4R18_005273 [Coemansia javaensis]|uniref:Uncharacterized protein n=1 Tax=Coemansia javaensis TaxID=2761396 RepID=A0A9W8H6G7_9FUNG|nr:hypothetical protein H4R18_005273 [Coemansia javaensis]
MGGAAQPGPAYVAQVRRPEPPRGGSGTPEAAEGGRRRSRLASLAKLGLFSWFGRWFIRYYEIDRSLRKEPGTPRISTGWLGLALLSLGPFVLAYLYASVWRRRVRRRPLDLQNWQAGSSLLVRAATGGLLLAWVSATIALFPGYGMASVLIVAVATGCAVAIADAAEGVL